MPTAPSRRAKRALVPFTLLALAASSAYAASPIPNSGSILDSVKPPAVQQPAAPAPKLSIQEQAPAHVDSGERIPVKAFRIDGQPPLPASELLALIESETGKDLTLGELNTLADKLTQYLRAKGYLVAFAYLPPQTIADGTVSFAVVPGHYGDIHITGHSRADAARIRDMLFCARPGSVIMLEPLERALLLINDLAGIQVKATLAPGKTAGTADLLLETADADSLSGVFYSDNWGSRYTGRVRYGVQASINNPSGSGDQITLGGLTTRDGINNYNLGYSLPVGVDGARFSVSYSHLGYTLGDNYAPLGATGRAKITSYQLSYPLLRSRSASLYGHLGYDHKQLRDDMAGYGSYNPRTSDLWHIGLSGNSADNWLGGGSNAFSLTYYHGRLAISDAASRKYDAATARTNGRFTKTVLTYQRQQALAQNLNFNLSLTGQLAGKNLDSSEKLYLGGADGVRAYPQGEGGGDQGYTLTGELRWLLPGASSNKHKLYLNTFYDYGHITVNKNPYAPGDNHRSLAAAGLGLLWVQEQAMTIRLDYAWKVGHDKANADTDKNGRCWLQAVKYF